MGRIKQIGHAVAHVNEIDVSCGIDFLEPEGHQLELFPLRTEPSEDAMATFRTVGALSTPLDLESIRD